MDAREEYRRKLPMAQAIDNAYKMMHDCTRNLTNKISSLAECLFVIALTEDATAEQQRKVALEALHKTGLLPKDDSNGEPSV